MTETLSDPSAKTADASAPMPLSVIVPNFNHARLIPRALHAFLNQTPPAKEIIVIDDGSTDNSVAVIEAIARRHPSVRLVRHEVNRGIVEAARSGLAAATGEYLLFGSADDYVLPGLFSHALAGFNENPRAAFFCASVALVDANDRAIGLRPFTTPRSARCYLSPEEVRRAIKKTDFWVIGTSTIYRRDLLAEIGYFEPSLGSIGDVLADRVLAFRHGFYFDPAVLGVYNKDPASFSGRNALSVERSRQMLDAAQLYMAAKLPEDVRAQHARLFDRRMRFGLARLWIVWRDQKELNVDAISDIANFGKPDRAILAFLAKLPLLSGALMLAWMTLRLRPFGIGGIVSAFWRAGVFRFFGRKRIQRRIDETIAQSDV